MRFLLLNLILLSALSGCSTVNGPNTALTSETPQTDADDPSSLIARFNEAYHRAAGTPPTPTPTQADVDDFLVAGLALTKSYCKDFFTSLGKEQQNLDAASGALALAGTATAGFLGISGASAQAIALAAAGFGTALGATELFQNVYLFHPETAAVQQMVDNAMALHAGEVLKRDDHTFETAHGAIRDSQDICSPAWIKRTVNDAIAKGNLKPKRDPSDLVTAPEDIRVVDRLAGALNVDDVAPDQVRFLFWYLFAEATDKEKKEVLSPGLKALANGPFAADGTEKTSWPQGDAVKAILEDLSGSYRERLAEEIADARGEGDGPALARDRSGEPSGGATLRSSRRSPGRVSIVID